MRLAITNETGDLLKTVEINSDLTVGDLKALAEAELGIPAVSQVISFNGVDLLDATKTIQQVGMKQDDIVLVKSNSSNVGRGGTDPIEAARQQLLSNPTSLARIARQNPELAAAVNNPAAFRTVVERLEAARREAERRQHEEAMLLHNADPFDIEAQRKIEEAIRQENIARNMELAMEHNPESFGRVVMLYINVEVNGHPVKAFVDSGAQATIMSPDCATKCNIMHLLDTRFAGIAEGVGTAKILGRVHSTMLKVGSQFLPCSFTVMEGKGVDLLFGLDMLKRHLAVIDLGKNCLRINSEDISFLPEHELPDRYREKNQPAEPDPAASSSSSSSAPAVGEPRAALAEPAKNTATKYPDEVIQNLVDLGASREEALMALEQSNGNAELAANLIFQLRFG
ncbi:DNA damage-inducible protein 1 [Chytridiales sp. JEL 0842]|nr:DNA damage-inducible protein 1 [Chytridiales sp. JEL 0842]